MFEKVSQMAEQMATRVSRRQFLGRFGGAALVAATTVGGLVALPGIGMADRKKGLPCGTGGMIDCTYRLTGDTCYTDHVAGYCRYSNSPLTPPTACDCYTGGGHKG